MMFARTARRAGAAFVRCSSSSTGLRQQQRRQQQQRQWRLPLAGLGLAAGGACWMGLGGDGARLDAPSETKRDVYAWGSGQFGQLGVGSEKDKSVVSVPLAASPCAATPHASRQSLLHRVPSVTVCRRIAAAAAAAHAGGVPGGRVDQQGECLRAQLRRAEQQRRGLHVRLRRQAAARPRPGRRRQRAHAAPGGGAAGAVGRAGGARRVPRGRSDGRRGGRSHCVERRTAFPSHGTPARFDLQLHDRSHDSAHTQGDAAAGALPPVATWQVWSWGVNHAGQLGRDHGGDEGGLPAEVAIPGRVVAIACGRKHTAAVTEEGRPAWGGLAV